MEELMQILKGLKPNVDFETETALIKNGILDSFDIVSMVTELNNAFDIEITASDLVFENFESANAILAMVTRLQEE